MAGFTRNGDAFDRYFIKWDLSVHTVMSADGVMDICLDLRSVAWRGAARRFCTSYTWQITLVHVDLGAH